MYIQTHVWQHVGSVGITAFLQIVQCLPTVQKQVDWYPKLATVRESVCPVGDWHTDQGIPLLSPVGWAPGSLRSWVNRWKLIGYIAYGQVQIAYKGK